MDMNFPHPRLAAEAKPQRAGYAALIASANARQANSQTVRALFSAPLGRANEINGLADRMAFFAHIDGKQRKVVCGAFSSSKIESAVNPADSNNLKLNQSETVKPGWQATQRGTEL
jgi:hypothetical protein